jgi:hypothetical protein
MENTNFDLIYGILTLPNLALTPAQTHLLSDLAMRASRPHPRALSLGPNLVIHRTRSVVNGNSQF